MHQLLALFALLDSMPFGKIQQLHGTYRINRFELTFLRIQGSPGAHPASIGELSFNPAQAGFLDHCLISKESQFAVSDFLIRRFNLGIDRFAKQNRGKEGSGSFYVIQPGQKMLKTDSVLVSKENIRLRFIVSFPSTSKGGGSFDGGQAKIMFEKELTQIASYSLVYSEYDEKSRQSLKEHIRVIEDRKYIHRFLTRNNGISFIPDNAVLPRMSGIDDRPLKLDTIALFKSPDSLAVEVELANRRYIRGMMLKAGIIMITGGGFHGKSTLLQADRKSVV